MVRMSEEEYERLKEKREALKEKRKSIESHPIKKEVRHKFNAKKTERDGFKFPSKKEARRYDELMGLKESGEVVFFLRQCPFHLPGNVTYRIDFVVFWADGHVSFEDPKGKITQQFLDKKKIVEALYPITIEVL